MSDPKEDVEYTKNLLKKEVKKYEISEIIDDHAEAIKVLSKLINRKKFLKSLISEIFDSYMMMTEVFEKGKKLFVCGNGGSMSDAQHIAGELNKSFKVTRPIPKKEKEEFEKVVGGQTLFSNLELGLPTIALGTNLSMFSAISNDIGYKYSFAQELYVFGQKGDLLLAISTSGDSENVVMATKLGKIMNVNVIAMTGKSGGKLSNFADLTINVPHQLVSKTQETHESIYHALCEMLEKHFFHGEEHA